MKLAIEEIRRLADEAAKQENPAFRVIGVTGGDGGTGYVEVLIDMVDCAHDRVGLWWVSIGMHL